MSQRKRYSESDLNRIYDRTSGKCHICHKQIAFGNYGVRGARGAWEVEHSRPLALGGSNHLNNLYAACIPCNCAKGVIGTRTARKWNGKTCAPLSRSKRAAAKLENAFAGSALLGTFGAAIGGPFGFLIGSALGATVGYDGNPDHK